MRDFAQPYFERAGVSEKVPPSPYAIPMVAMHAACHMNTVLSTVLSHLQLSSSQAPLAHPPQHGWFR